MARKYIKRITESEFNRYLILRKSLDDYYIGAVSWDNIPLQERARLEKEYFTLETRLFHTLGFKKSEEESAKWLKDAKDKFEIYQELTLAESKMIREKAQKEYKNFDKNIPNVVILNTKE